MKILALFLLISCASQPSLDVKIYSLGNDGLYRNQDSEFIPITDPKVNRYFCVDDTDLMEMIQAIKGE